MEEYKRRRHDDNGIRIVPPKIPTNMKFELTGHILSMLKDIPFLGGITWMHISTLMSCCKSKITLMYQMLQAMQCSKDASGYV